MSSRNSLIWALGSSPDREPKWGVKIQMYFLLFPLGCLEEGRPLQTLTRDYDGSGPLWSSPDQKIFLQHIQYAWAFMTCYGISRQRSSLLKKLHSWARTELTRSYNKFSSKAAWGNINIESFCRLPVWAHMELTRPVEYHAVVFPLLPVTIAPNPNHRRRPQ